MILIRGAGDMASGIAVRLYRCGFTLAMTDLAHLHSSDGVLL